MHSISTRTKLPLFNYFTIAITPLCVSRMLAIVVSNPLLYCNEMRIPERDVTYIVFSVYLLTLIHGYPLNRKQSSHSHKA